MTVVTHAQPAGPLPFVKSAEWGEQKIYIEAHALNFDPDRLQDEALFLSSALDEAGISLSESGTALTLAIGPVDFPEITSQYAEHIKLQGYRLVASPEEVKITAPTAAGVFYGIQTLLQMIQPDGAVPEAAITDWPDLAVRMIMVDPARQNENFDYYRRVIRFCARYKINTILCHLTDDQTSCLYHEKYPDLLHFEAWTPEEIRSLVDYAAKHHIELIPEIESFGHSKMFTRMEDFKDYLHQTDAPRTVTWMGTDIPGWTNVLCPASEKAAEYLEDMYQRAALSFPTDLLHIGFDEVDMTRCARCEKQFPGYTQSEWFLHHLLHCRNLAGEHFPKMGLWGDMLLKYPEIVDGLPKENTLIFDWHYRETVDDSSVKFFKDKGFEIMASPALVCSPHMILPDRQNYANIRKFASIARQHDVLGMNTTIWIPTRYMSDVLWPGIAFAAVHSWAGSDWNREQFYSRFLQDFYGCPRGKEYQAIRDRLFEVLWHAQEINRACWRSEETLAEAREWIGEHESEVRADLVKVQSALEDFKQLRPFIKKHQTEWQTFERSLAVMAFTMKHKLAALDIRKDGRWDTKKLKQLQQECRQAIEWVEADWDRNRYPDDPNKDGVFLPHHNLLCRLRQVQAFHEEILED